MRLCNKIQLFTFLLVTALPLLSLSAMENNNGNDANQKNSFEKISTYFQKQGINNPALIQNLKVLMSQEPIIAALIEKHPFLALGFLSLFTNELGHVPN